MTFNTKNDSMGRSNGPTIGPLKIKNKQLFAQTSN